MPSTDCCSPWCPARAVRRTARGSSRRSTTGPTAGGPFCYPPTATPLTPARSRRSTASGCGPNASRGRGDRLPHAGSCRRDWCTPRGPRGGGRGGGGGGLGGGGLGGGGRCGGGVFGWGGGRGATPPLWGGGTRRGRRRKGGRG